LWERKLDERRKNSKVSKEGEEKREDLPIRGGKSLGGLLGSLKQHLIKENDSLKKMLGKSKFSK